MIRQRIRPARAIRLVTQFNLHPLLKPGHALFAVLSIWSLRHRALRPFVPVFPLPMKELLSRITRVANSFADRSSHRPLPATAIDVKSRPASFVALGAD